MQLVARALAKLAGSVFEPTVTPTTGRNARRYPRKHRAANLVRIALDATPLIEPAGGIPRYVTELALALALQRPDDEIHLLSDQTALHIDPRLRQATNVRLDPPNQWGRSKWWSMGLPFELRRRRIDVFHGTNFEVPYLNLTPAVMTIHDLSPWKPEPLRPPGCERVRNRTPRLVRLAKHIITPTQAIRAEVLEQFGAAPERVIAIPHAPSDALAPPTPEEAAAVRLDLGLPRRYLVAIGAGNQRKDIPTLLKAWRACRDRRPELGLVVIGAGASATMHEPHEQLALLDGASDAETAAALAGAAALVYPSLYEGFGLPLVEAMRAGVAVIASSDVALVEVAAGAVLHFRAGSAEDLATAIDRLLSDADEAAGLIDRGLRRASDFSWSDTARRTRAVYEQSIRRA